MGDGLGAASRIEHPAHRQRALNGAAKRGHGSRAAAAAPVVTPRWRRPARFRTFGAL